MPAPKLDSCMTPTNAKIMPIRKLISPTIGSASAPASCIASQTCDGSSAVLVVSEEALKRYNLTPRARIVHMSVRADDPIWMLTAPIPATEHAMKKSGMKLDDIDLVEINEAFAAQVLACLQAFGARRFSEDHGLGAPVGAVLAGQQGKARAGIPAITPDTLRRSDNDGDSHSTRHES